MTQEALKLALEALENGDVPTPENAGKNLDAITAIKEALAQTQEPVMILSDGSAFGVMSFPLPDDHWLYAPNEYRDGEYEPIDLPKPILTYELRDAVVAAVRYAVRGATMRGQETDFDPDALVQNAVYTLCGPYTTPPQRTEQEPVATVTSETGADITMSWWHEPALPIGTKLFTYAPQRTEQEPVGFAGVKIWVGNQQVVKLLTQTELHHAIDPWLLVKLNAEMCIEKLKGAA